MKTNKLTLSFSETAKLIGTGKDNISMLVNKGELGFIAFDKLGKNRRIAVTEIERFINDHILFVKQNRSK